MKKVLQTVLISYFLVLILPSILLFNNSSEKTVEAELPENTDAKERSEITVSVNGGSGKNETMSLRDYLVSVVLCEMPVSFNDEALKAQAIVARTYTLRSAKHSDFDVCTNAGCCQGYRSCEEFLNTGGTEDGINKVMKAVDDTEGLVLTYGGDLIEATYFSCSGGMTEDAVAVWGKDVPYLKATYSPGEEMASHYTDKVVFSEDELSRLLSVASEKPPSAWIEDITFTGGGGVDRIRICGQTFSGVTIRKVLGLRSTAFTVSYIDGGFAFQTKGYGHRVGMSQYGAEAMALNGANFEQILLHYYDGVKLSYYTAED